MRRSTRWASAFFWGYCIFEIPSNIVLEKIGARVGIARIMITWGLLAVGTAFVTGVTSFAIVRCLLGVAEAGFFPGIVLYFTYWFPGRYRGRVVGAFMTALPISIALGSPISTALLGARWFPRPRGMEVGVHRLGTAGGPPGHQRTVRPGWHCREGACWPTEVQRELALSRSLQRSAVRSTGCALTPCCRRSPICAPSRSRSSGSGRPPPPSASCCSCRRY